MRALLVVFTVASVVVLFGGVASAKPGHPEPASVVWDKRETPLRHGESATIGFMVLHEGKCVERVAGQEVDPYIEATNIKSGEKLRFDAHVDAPLHFAADVELPDEGQWELTIRSDRIEGLASSRIYMLAGAPEPSSDEDSVLGLDSSVALLALVGVVVGGATLGTISARRVIRR